MINCFGLVLTLILFAIFYRLKDVFLLRKIPIIASVGVLIILILSVFKIDFVFYNESAKYLSYMIAPATLAFAYPLYKNSDMLMKDKRILYPSLLIGALSAVVSTYLCAKLAHADIKVILSMLPKSTTMPIAVEISRNTGGCLELTACVVVMTGVLGAVLGHFVLRKLNIKNDTAIGLAIGSASHVIGTASCAQKNKLKQVAAGTIALILVGLITAILIPLVKILLHIQ